MTSDAKLQNGGSQPLMITYVPRKTRLRIDNLEMSKSAIRAVNDLAKSERDFWTMFATSLGRSSSVTDISKPLKPPCGVITHDHVTRIFSKVRETRASKVDDYVLIDSWGTSAVNRSDGYTTHDPTNSIICELADSLDKGLDIVPYLNPHKTPSFITTSLYYTLRHQLVVNGKHTPLRRLAGRKLSALGQIINLPLWVWPTQAIVIWLREVAIYPMSKQHVARSYQRFRTRTLRKAFVERKGMFGGYDIDESRKLLLGVIWSDEHGPERLFTRSQVGLIDTRYPLYRSDSNFMEDAVHDLLFLRMLEEECIETAVKMWKEHDVPDIDVSKTITWMMTPDHNFVQFKPNGTSIEIDKIIIP